MRRRVGVLISGRGSNLGALIAAARDPAYPAAIVLAASNRAGAGGLALAQAAGIATATVPHRDHPTREAFERALDAALAHARCDLVCCAGFMRVLTAWFVARWQGRLLNIHPSLLPAFPGLDTHRRALAAGVRIAGCTVHFVTAALDDGPIVVQAAVPVQPGDDPETLAARVLAAEHRAYPLALALVASGRARLEGGRVRLDAGAEGMLLSPAS